MVRYARKGFLASMVGLVGNLLSLLGAHQLSAACAGWVFEHMLAGGFRTQIAANIAPQAVRWTFPALRKSTRAFCPPASGHPSWRPASAPLGPFWPTMPWCWPIPLWRNVLQPLLTPVITLVLFFLFYALLRLLVSMLVTVLGLVNKLPVIGTVNRGLGWLVGAGTALLDVYLVLCILWGLIVITGGSLNVLNDTVMSTSLYYKIFNLFNPFL